MGRLATARQRYRPDLRPCLVRRLPSLLVLYIVRAREIRKLRREAPFLAESNGNPES